MPTSSRARRAPRIPKLRHHKSNDQAFVEAHCERHYFGKWGSPETVERYHRWVAEYVANDYRPPMPPADAVHVSEVAAQFWRYAERHYRRPDGTEGPEIPKFRIALRPVLELYGGTLANEFGPRRLKAVRKTWIDAGHSRRYINGLTQRICLMFRWAAAEEIVGPSVAHALRAVRGLAIGDPEVREAPPVLPVSTVDVARTLPHLSRPVRALAELQLLSGARPGELLRLRAVDIDTTGDVWLYRPAEHKNAHRGHTRTIYFAAEAQAVLRPFLAERPVSEPLFSPREAERERREREHAARTTPLKQGNAPGTNRKRRPKQQPGDTYTVNSYRRAIERACKRAGVDKWTPGRLRHTVATEIRKQHGLESASVVLGHARTSTTEIYAERNEAKALEIVPTLKRPSA